PARGVRRGGRRGRPARDPPRGLRLRGHAAQDRARGAPALPGRPAGGGRLRRPSPMRDRLQTGALLAGSGVLQALAFPRADWEIAAWVALMPLFVLALGARPRAAFGWGWLQGLVFFLVLLRWLDFTFRTYSEIPWPLTWGPLFLLAAWCGLYTGAVAGFVSLIAHRGARGWALATAPCLWV